MLFSVCKISPLCCVQNQFVLQLPQQIYCTDTVDKQMYEDNLLTLKSYMHTLQGDCTL